MTCFLHILKILFLNQIKSTVLTCWRGGAVPGEEEAALAVGREEAALHQGEGVVVLGQELHAGLAAGWRPARLEHTVETWRQGGLLLLD